MSAFVELLRKSNLDYAVARKPFRVGSRSDDIIFVSFVDMRIKKLQVRSSIERAIQRMFCFSYSRVWINLNLLRSGRCHWMNVLFS